MRLGNAMFAGWIADVSFFGDDFSLAGDAALQLGLNFSTTALFERICATTSKRRARDRDQDRHGPHPLILGMKLAKANRQD